MNSPCVSPGFAILVMLALILGFAIAGVVLVVTATMKSIAVGHQLLDACAGDYRAAKVAIDSVRRENQILDDLIRRGLAVRRVEPKQFWEDIT